MRNDLYTESGSPLGFHDGNFIYDLQGRFVGQLHGSQVYCMAGHHVGELEDRVIHGNRRVAGGARLAAPRLIDKVLEKIRYRYGRWKGAGAG